jgi:hypothetical protein
MGFEKSGLTGCFFPSALASNVLAMGLESAVLLLEIGLTVSMCSES